MTADLNLTTERLEDVADWIHNNGSVSDGMREAVSALLREVRDWRESGESPEVVRAAMEAVRESRNALAESGMDLLAERDQPQEQLKASESEVKRLRAHKCNPMGWGCNK